MGDRRFDAAYALLEDAEDPSSVITRFSDEELVNALAAASTRKMDPYAANVLATEIVNRLNRKSVVLDTADEGLVSLDTRGCLTYANPAARALIGVTVAEHAEDDSSRVHVKDFLPEDVDWESTPFGDAALRGRAGRVNDTTFRGPDGDTVPVAYAAAPILRDGDLVGAVVAFRDVTARNQAAAEREALLESTRRRAAELDAVFENIPDAIYIGDESGIKKANALALEMLGFETLTELNRKIPDLAERIRTRDPSTGRRLQPEEEAFVRALNGERAVREVLVRHLQSGEDAILRSAAAPVVLDGEIIGAVAVNTDITDVKAQEAAVREGRDRLEGLLQRITDAFFTVDRDWRFTYLNPQAEALLQQPASELVGESVWDAYPEAVGSQFHEEYHRAVRENAPVRFESYFPPLDKWFEVHAYPGPHDLSVFFRDVTHRHQAEAALKRARDDLQERVTERTRELAAVNAELEAFSHTVSHDLRAPLRGIEYFSRLLEEEARPNLSVEQREYLDRLRSESARLTTLVKDLLDLSRVTSGDLARMPVDVTTLAHDVVRVLRTAHPERDVDVRVEDDLTANADPRLVRVVLENLLGNAWKYTAHEDEARVTVGATVADGEKYLFVRDNGIGFDQASAKGLFTAFQRLPSAASFEGSGVGLATVARIVTRHGGNVYAEATPGEGATFFFRF